ncbi:hypothetical protein A9Q81_01380 [Gammaproteobacteria bacterium 42_54_T18]|nr:hypothetical protein A9Q81_01380 [Gammaproteobacteria bacterium 42_54_T18]
MKNVVVTMLMLIVCLPLSQVLVADTWMGAKKVVSVQLVQTGGMIIYFDSEVSPTCTTAGTSSLYIYPDQVGVTTDGAKAFLSASLTALSTGMSVDVMYDDSATHCWGKYLVIKK